MGNDLGRAPLGGNDIVGMYSCRYGCFGTIVLMRLCGKTVRLRLLKRGAKIGRWDMRSFVGRERYEKCACSCWFELFRTNFIHPIAPKTSEMEATTGWMEGKPWEIMYSCWHGFSRQITSRRCAVTGR